MKKHLSLLEAASVITLPLAAVLFLAAIVLTLSGCFSPWAGDTGYIQIGGAGSGGLAKTVIPGTGELAVMRYEVTLSGPGGTLRKTLGAGGGTVELAPGAWHIAVKAYNSEPRLRGMVSQNLTVGAGKTETVTLKSVVGIQTGQELVDALNNTSTMAQYIGASDPDNILVIENTFPAVPISASIPLAANYTIMVETGKTLTIERDSSLTSAYMIVTGGKNLTLGSAMPGFTGTVDIAGNSTAGLSLIRISGGGQLTMYDGATIRNNNATSGGGGVLVDNGTFTMYGGTIRNNTVTGGNAGGVLIASGTFIMKNGSIRNNTANSGGGINVGDGTHFYMEGGTISGNTSNNFGGGGIFVSSGGTGGTVEMSGGIITGNQTVNGGGGGVHVLGELIMTNGVISGNTVRVNVGGVGGGGVYVGSSGIVTMSGGVIGGNSPAEGNKAESTTADAYGGGVLITNGGTFHMSGNAAIKGNLVDGGTVGHSEGGGVHVRPGGTFTMNGGTISGNIALSGGGHAYGGGIYGTAGTLTLTSGTVTGNTVNSGFSSGGGIWTAGTNPGTGSVIISGNHYAGTLVGSPGPNEPDWDW